jgi:16S rRNA (uracil1498-N3)-methyltransferase
MPPRFWTSLPLAVGPFVLNGPEAHHVSNVLRLTVRDAVELFDGQGRAAEGVITAIARRSVELQITAVRETPPILPRITLAAAVPKGERFDWLVEKTAELGVAQLVPLRTARGTVDPRDSKLDRLRQVVIAACKQSRNNWAMEIAAPIAWDEWLSTKSKDIPLLIADAGGGALESRIGPETLEVLIAIGPEGGWTAEELAAGQTQGGQLVSLGPTILRIETAAIVAAALVRG